VAKFVREKEKQKSFISSQSPPKQHHWTWAEILGSPTFSWPPVALSLVQDPRGHMVTQVVCTKKSHAVRLQELPSEKGTHRFVPSLIH